MSAPQKNGSVDMWLFHGSMSAPHCERYNISIECCLSDKSVEVLLIMDTFSAPYPRELQHDVYTNKCCLSNWSVGVLLFMNKGQLHTCQRAY